MHLLTTVLGRQSRLDFGLVDIFSESASEMITAKNPLLEIFKTHSTFCLFVCLLLSSSLTVVNIYVSICCSIVSVFKRGSIFGCLVSLFRFD